MNPKKWRGWCTNCRRNEIKINATKYCSIRCQHDYQFRQREALLKSGEYRTSGKTNPPFLRRYLVKLLGERCQRCGWAVRHPFTKKVPVEVEHIDGAWHNNRLDNLTLLCPNCHSLTATFRALNKGRGRQHRRSGKLNSFPLTHVEGSLETTPRKPKNIESAAELQLKLL